MTAILGELDLPSLGFGPLSLDRMRLYVDLLKKWNPAINLVSPASLADVWRRHLADSAQLLRLASQETGLWVDLGSGAGFPGLVVAILAAEERPGLEVVLVEADLRKCSFLQTVSRETSIPIRICSERIESLAPIKADILSARALAPLTVLCSYAHRHLQASGTAFFPKGARVDDEIAEARQRWQFSLTRHQSKTDPAATILEMRGFKHV